MDQILVTNSQCWLELVPKRRDSYGYGAIGKF